MNGFYDMYQIYYRLSGGFQTTVIDNAIVTTTTFSQSYDLFNVLLTYM